MWPVTSGYNDRCVSAISSITVNQTLYHTLHLHINQLKWNLLKHALIDMQLCYVRQYSHETEHEKSTGFGQIYDSVLQPYAVRNELVCDNARQAPELHISSGGSVIY